MLTLDLSTVPVAKLLGLLSRLLQHISYSVHQYTAVMLILVLVLANLVLVLVLVGLVLVLVLVLACPVLINITATQLPE